MKKRDGPFDCARNDISIIFAFYIFKRIHAGLRRTELVEVLVPQPSAN